MSYPVEVMRSIALVILTYLCGAAAAFSQSAPGADWREYVYLDRGFAIQFPAPPSITAGTLETALFEDLPASVYSAEFDNVTYRMTVVDLGDRINVSANLLIEVAFNLMREGTLLFTTFPRVYNGEQSAFGVTVVVDLPDGNRTRTTLYYRAGRLYRADAIISPERGDMDMATPSRFDQTLRFPPDGRFD